MSDREYDRSQLIKWYDEHAARYDQSSFVQTDTQYGGDLYRIELVSSLLAEHRPARTLDVGCGTGVPMRRFLKEGYDVRGFDLSPGMIEQAKAGLVEDGRSADLAEVGDILSKDTLGRFEGQTFDAVIANGVMPYIEDDETAHANLASLVKPGGLYISAYSNALLDLFTLNRFTLRTMSEMISHPGKIADGDENDILDRLPGLLTHPDKPQEFLTGARNDIFVTSHNPYEIEQELQRFGLQPVDILFYKFHAFPPILADTPERRKVLFEASRAMEIEYARDWRGRFMASTFIMIARKTG